MTRELKNIEASIKRRLYNVAKKERLNFDFILLLFMQERLLYRLSISKYNQKFILKGGLLILSTLQRRETPLEKKLVLFTEEFVRDDGRIKMWNGYIKKIGKELIDFDIVMDRLRIFLLPIYEKILKKEEFFKKWDNNKGRWI